MKAVVHDFTETRSGKNAEAFLGAWRGKLVCDAPLAATATGANVSYRARIRRRS